MHFQSYFQDNYTLEYVRKPGRLHFAHTFEVNMDQHIFGLYTPWSVSTLSSKHILVGTQYTDRLDTAADTYIYHFDIENSHHMVMGDMGLHFQ